MTNFATLQADIIDWSARDDVSGKIEMFIRAAEPGIFRSVRIMEQETEIALSFAGSAYEDDIPTGFVGFKSIRIDNVSNPKAVYVPPQTFHNESQSRDAFETLDVDYIYTVESNKIKLKPAAGATDPVTGAAVYFLKPNGITSLNTTNVILTAHYDVYLWACLEQLWDWADEQELSARYHTRLAKSIEEIRLHENERRRPPGPLVRRMPQRRVR